MLALLSASLQLLATHVVGGEIYYTWQGNNTYLITLKVYRDCGPTNQNGTGFDDVASVGIFNSNGQLVDELGMNLFNAEVNFIPVALENPCFIVPTDVCVESAIYQETVTLPPTPGGYTLSYQRCCRNPSIININQPQNSGATFTCRIPGTNQTNLPNSSPVFVNFPPPALCANAEFFFDHQAIDPDGDVLVYEFCTPLLGASPDFPAPQPPDGPPYQPISWANGFSEGYPVTSAPPLAIDPATGFITGTPTQPGQYVIGVCVSEYRNGVLLNTVNRDFQVNVTICDPNIVAVFPDQTNFCDGITVQFENQSINATSFEWDFGVADTDTDLSSEPDPLFTFPAEGIYTITLIANPGWGCADTAYSTYQVLPVIQPVIITQGGECINNQVLYNFTFDANISPQAIFTWDFGAGSVPSTSAQNSPQGVALNQEAANHLITLTISDNGCLESDSETLDNPPEPFASIVPQQSFCDGLTYSFQSASTNAESVYWDFNTPINGDNSTQLNPIFTFPDSGQFVITHIAIAPFTCPDTTQMTFDIYEDLNPFFESLDPQCLSSNAFDFLGMGATTAGAVYFWQLGLDQSSNSQAPQNVSFDEAGTYPITLTIAENGCEESYSDDVWVAADPTLDVALGNTEGCPELYVQFNAESFAETQVFFSWDFGDGATSSAQNPAHIYTQSGTYDVSLIAGTFNGCLATLTRTFPGAVQVYPVPIPGFSIEPQTVDILDPIVQITNESDEGNTCLYVMSDGGLSEDCDFEYGFTQSGRQFVVQYVTNEYGCTSSVTGIVLVEGFLFWAPNSFTPSDDGINDAWRPISTGVSSFALVIRDRWGTIIHQSVDPDEAWYGQVRGGTHFAENGVYHYHVRIKDLLEFPHEFNGHITVIR